MKFFYILASFFFIHLIIFLFSFNFVAARRIAKFHVFARWLREEKTKKKNASSQNCWLLILRYCLFFPRNKIEKNFSRDVYLRDVWKNSPFFVTLYDIAIQRQDMLFEAFLYLYHIIGSLYCFDGALFL